MSCVWQPILKGVIGLSIKDRGAILPAGHFASGHFGIAQVRLFPVLLWFKFA
jgi:hypothetical protein